MDPVGAVGRAVVPRSGGRRRGAKAGCNALTPGLEAAGRSPRLRSSDQDTPNERDSDADPDRRRPPRGKLMSMAEDLEHDGAPADAPSPDQPPLPGFDAPLNPPEAATPISSLVTDPPQAPGRVDAAEAVTGRRAIPGGEASASEDPGQDASLEEDAGARNP